MHSIKRSVPIAFSIMAVSMAMFATLMLRIHPVSALTQECSQIASAADAPDGFGVAVNLFSTTQEKVISASCSDTQVTISVGNGYANQYIYNQGYEYVNNAWKPILFSGTTMDGSWIIGSASKTLTRTAGDLAQTNYVVAYICTSVDSAWKCGCRDITCANHFWQLQAFKQNADMIPPSVPTGLKYTVSSTGDVMLSWNHSTDNIKVYGYNVYRDGILIFRTSGTAFLDQTGGRKGNGDVYQVSAYDGYNGTGNESAKSNSVTVHISGNTPPSQTQCPGSNARIDQCSKGCVYYGVPLGCITREYYDCIRRGECRTGVCLAYGTKIATPQGDIAVESITPGMLVWTTDAQGERVSAPVVRTSKTPVNPSQHVVHLTLADGRSLFVSPGHPTADNRTIGKLKKGDTLNGAVLQDVTLVSYTSGYTYDILPAGATGEYFANGILIGSTLK